LSRLATPPYVINPDMLQVIDDATVGERCMENKKFLRTRKIYPWRCIATRGGEHLHTLVDR
jgi:hypothetical protein